jgi:TolB-like protein/class 3 adenylate cyclase
VSQNRLRPATPRHLAVVLFADVVGYTSIVSEDEARARTVRAAMTTVVRDALGAHGGTLVQSFGDGTLCVFSSAVEAALAAAEIQTRFSSGASAELRIGLHLGEISWDAEGAYGDAVNVAARLQTIATPGSVLVSEEVARQLRSRREVPQVEVGMVRLKNVDEPVRVYALAFAGLRQPGLAEIVGRARESGGGGATEHEMMPRSLAVLPLANFSHEPSQEYFVAGMHEALLTELARIRALKVISRTSVLRYRDTTEPLTDIAKALGVDALIEGSVMRAGDRVRITAQLIAVRPERHLWAESYDGDLGDVLALHGRVASEVATAVQSTLQPREAARLNERRHVDPDAYEAYLRGRFAANRVHEDAGLAEALTHFEVATRIDPSFALPWVGIARALTYRALFGHADRAATIDRCRQAIAHALALDPDLAEAHATRGHTNLIFNADARAAVRDLERAVAIDSNSVPALIDYGMALNACGRYRDAADAFDRASERDPLSPTTAMMRGWGRFMGRRFAEARQILEQGARVTPEFSYHHLWLAASLLALGRPGEARAAAERARALEGESEDVNFQCVIGWIWAGVDDREEASRMRERMMQPRSHGSVLDPGFMVVIESALGDDDSAFRYLERSVTTRSPILFHMPGHPFLDRLRKDPRFAVILAEAGLEVLEV